MGVILFRGKSQVVTGIGNAGDPFGNVLEAMFSMFRVLTGEDWTDLRYDLLVGQSEQGQFLITTFFVSFRELRPQPQPLLRCDYRFRDNPERRYHSCCKQLRRLSL